MTAIDGMPDDSRYARCIQSSKRVYWDIDEDVIRGRRFDARDKFLPDGLSLADTFTTLSSDERRFVSQIQGRTYANIFGLVERFINAKILELGRGHALGDVSRADGADVVMLPTDLSAETGVPPLTNAVEGTAEAGFPDEIAPRSEDYVFLKRRPSAFYGTGVAELLHMLRRDTIIIGGGATNRGVETSVREAFNLDLASIVVRECCWSSDAAAHCYSLDKAMKMYARIRSLDQVTAMLRE